MKDYLCEYQFNGAAYGFTIKANSHAEAALRLMQIRDGWVELKGEVVATVRLPSFLSRLFGVQQ